MASSLRKAAQARAAKKSNPVAAGGMAARGAAADKMAKKASKQGNAAGMSFKGSNRSAAYRGAASKAMRGGQGSLAGHKAGMKAEQAYAG